MLIGVYYKSPKICIRFLLIFQHVCAPLKVVVLRNLFDPREFDEDASRILEYSSRLREHCAKFGRVTKAWLPDGYSQIFRSYVFGPSGFWTMAPLRYTAKFEPSLFLECARV